MTSFPEDLIQLLGPEVRTLTPIEFHTRILGMYLPLTSKGRGEIPLKGRRSRLPTKKHPGIFELSRQTMLGLKQATFEFDKTFEVEESKLEGFSKELLCSIPDLRSFLEKKNFILISRCNSNEEHVTNLLTERESFVPNPPGASQLPAGNELNKP